MENYSERYFKTYIFFYELLISRLFYLLLSDHDWSGVGVAETMEK